MIDVRLLQPGKAPSPILVTELGIVTEVRLLHSQKALSPILVTEFGIVTDVNLLQPLYLYIILYQLITC